MRCAGGGVHTGGDCGKVLNALSHGVDVDRTVCDLTIGGCDPHTARHGYDGRPDLAHAIP